MSAISFQVRFHQEKADPIKNSKGTVTSKGEEGLPRLHFLSEGRIRKGNKQHDVALKNFEVIAGEEAPKLGFLERRKYALLKVEVMDNYGNLMDEGWVKVNRSSVAKRFNMKRGEVKGDITDKLLETGLKQAPEAPKKGRRPREGQGAKGADQGIPAQRNKPPIFGEEAKEDAEYAEKLLKKGRRVPERRGSLPTQERVGHEEAREERRLSAPMPGEKFREPVRERRPLEHSSRSGSSTTEDELDLQRPTIEKFCEDFISAADEDKFKEIYGDDWLDDEDLENLGRNQAILKKHNIDGISLSEDGELNEAFAKALLDSGSEAQLLSHLRKGALGWEVKEGIAIDDEREDVEASLREKLEPLEKFAGARKGLTDMVLQKIDEEEDADRKHQLIANVERNLAKMGAMKGSNKEVVEKLLAD